MYQDGLIVGDSSRCHQNVLERISIIDAQQDNVLLKRVQKLILCDIDVNQEDSVSLYIHIKYHIIYFSFRNKEMLSII